MSTTDAFLVVVYGVEITSIAVIGVWMLVKLYRHVDDDDEEDR